MCFTFGSSFLVVEEGVCRISLRAPDRDSAGLAMGKLLAMAGHPAVPFFRSPWVRALFRPAREWVHRRLRRKVRIPEEYIDEVRGCAEGAGIAFADLFLANFCYDAIPGIGFHCSTAAFFNRDSLYLLRNTDLQPWFAPTALKYGPAVWVDQKIGNGRRVCHCSPPFYVGVIAGYNELHLVAGSHQVVRVRRGPSEVRLATPLLLRMLLESTGSLADASAFLRTHRVPSSINVLVASAPERDARLYELGSAEIRRLPMQGRYLCATTHFQSDHMRRYHRTLVRCSDRRLDSMHRLLRERSALGQDEAIAILRDDSNGRGFGVSGRSLTNRGTYQSYCVELPSERVAMANGRRIPVSMTGAYVAFSSKEPLRAHP